MIAGKVHFANPETVTEACDIRIIVEDTSRVDASARPVAELSLTVDPDTLSDGIEFVFQDEDPSPGLNLRAHLSRDGSSNIDVGDHISTQAYPAAASGVDITVREVR